MDCLETKKNLAAYLDDLLDGKRAEAIESHLFGCEPCRAERDRVERLFSYAAALPMEAPSPRVWEKIRAALREPKPLPWTERLRDWARESIETTAHYFPSYAAGAASAALLLIFVLPLGAGPQKNPGLRQENDRPLGQAGLVATPDMQNASPYGNGYPVRLIGGEGAAPGKRLVSRDGQLYEIEEPPARPRVEYPVRDIGTHAVLRRDF